MDGADRGLDPPEASARQGQQHPAKREKSESRRAEASARQGQQHKAAEGEEREQESRGIGCNFWKRDREVSLRS